MAKRKHECPPHDDSERWAISYLDFITVMMCLFIVLYALSQVDMGKLAKLRASLAAGFNNAPVATAPIVTDGGMGVLAGSTSVLSMGQFMGAGANQNGSGTPEQLAAMSEARRLDKIRDEMDKQLQAAGQNKALEYRITEKGLVIGMVANDTFFHVGDDQLQPAAEQVLSLIAPTLSAVPDQIDVEGFADPTPIHNLKFEDNDALASSRANQVRRYLKNSGVPGARLRSTSYGSDHQASADQAVDPFALNRRVDIVIMSSAKESVRQLLPKASKAIEGPQQSPRTEISGDAQNTAPPEKPGETPASNPTQGALVPVKAVE